MLKKFIVAGLAIAVGLGVVAIAFPKILEAVCAWCEDTRRDTDTSASESIKKSKPTAKRLGDIKDRVKALDAKEPELYDSVAKEAVEVEKLEAKVESAGKAVKKQEAVVKSLADALRGDDETTKVSWNGKDWDRKDVTTQLDADLKLLKVKKAELESGQSLLVQNRTTLAKAKEQFGQLRQERNEMLLEIAKMESELASVEASEAGSKIATKDSEYSKLRASMNDIRDEIKVRQAKLDLETEFADGPLHVPSATKPTAKDLIKQADALTGNGDKSVAEDK